MNEKILAGVGGVLVALFMSACDQTTAGKTAAETIGETPKRAVNAGGGGPFGLEKGMTLEQIAAGPGEIAPGVYSLNSVPKPHSAFETYVAKVGQKSGLCLLKGIGRDISTNVYGEQLEGEFNKLKDRLQEIYGTPKVTDMLYAGSIWDEPKDWMMALVQQERVLQAVWEPKSNVGGLEMIGLAAKPNGTDSGYLILEYHFTNKTECEAEIARREDAAL